jgi:hypothetical protein
MLLERVAEGDPQLEATRVELLDGSGPDPRKIPATVARSDAVLR